MTASGFALVSKEWYTEHGMVEKTKIVLRTFPLLTTSKSVIINDSHGAKKTCISVIIGDHPGFDSDRWQIFEKVSSPASSPIPVTIRRGIHNRKCEDQSTNLI